MANDAIGDQKTSAQHHIIIKLKLLKWLNLTWTPVSLYASRVPQQELYFPVGFRLFLLLAKPERGRS